ASTQHLALTVSTMCTPASATALLGGLPGAVLRGGSDDGDTLGVTVVTCGAGELATGAKLALPASEFWLVFPPLCASCTPKYAISATSTIAAAAAPQFGACRSVRRVID